MKNMLENWQEVIDYCDTLTLESISAIELEGESDEVRQVLREKRMDTPEGYAC